MKISWKIGVSKLAVLMHHTDHTGERERDEMRRVSPSAAGEILWTHYLSRPCRCRLPACVLRLPIWSQLVWSTSRSGTAAHAACPTNLSPRHPFSKQKQDCTHAGASEAVPHHTPNQHVWSSTHGLFVLALATPQAYSPWAATTTICQPRNGWMVGSSHSVREPKKRWIYCWINLIWLGQSDMPCHTCALMAVTEEGSPEERVEGVREWEWKWFGVFVPW